MMIGVCVKYLLAGLNLDPGCPLLSLVCNHLLDVIWLTECITLQIGLTMYLCSYYKHYYQIKFQM